MRFFQPPRATSHFCFPFPFPVPVSVSRFLLFQLPVKHLCIAEINVNHSHSFSLALFSSFQLLYVVFILQLVNHASFRVAIAIRECTACASICVCVCMYSCVRVRVLASDTQATRKRLASAVNLLVSGIVH